MRGEELPELFLSFSGVRGDRLFAFHSSASREDFPYFTAREQREMLRYRPTFRPTNKAGDEAMIDVGTPSRETFRIDDPALLDRLRRGVDPKHGLTLMRSDRPLTDAYPISVFSLQTVAKLSEETGAVWDKRRFRANIYLDCPGAAGFIENEFVGRSLRVGPEAVIAIVQRDTRCVMINLDPDTTEMAPALLKTVAQAHGGNAGVYGNVLVEGPIRKGDAVQLLDPQP